MQIKETNTTVAVKKDENGKEVCSLQSNGQYESRIVIINLNEEYYKNNKESMQKEILSFLDYSILGYTEDESVEVINTEDEIKPSYDEETKQITEEQEQAILEQYGEVTPQTIDEYFASLQENSSEEVIEEDEE